MIFHPSVGCSLLSYCSAWSLAPALDYSLACSSIPSYAAPGSISPPLYTGVQLPLYISLGYFLNISSPDDPGVLAILYPHPNYLEAGPHRNHT